MLDWLLIWGVTQGVGVLVTPILQDLAKEGAKDFAKDFFKDSLKHVLLREKDPRQVAAGKAIKEFLQLVQQQLKIRCKLPENEIKPYIQEVKRFISDKSVKSILGKAFEIDCDSLDATTLKNTWNSLQLKPLPNNFNWDAIINQYLMNVQEILFDSKDLRDLLDSQNIEKIEKSTQEIAGIIPDFDLLGYQEAIKETYGNLKLESLDTTGYAYNELKLWRMFIAQNVREVHQVLPQIYELPKEHLNRLRESNQLEAEVAIQELERYKQSYFEQATRPVLDIINDKQNYKYVVILGDPGSGKSTLLQFLALNWAESPIDNVISQPIPLLIELRTYMRRREDNECHDFIEFFHKCSGSIYHLNQHKLHEQLLAGNALVMFDGLDEVFDPGKREDVITDIHRFTNKYPQVRVIVTSRVIGYKTQRLRDTEFHHFMLQDLDAEQIQDFINRWHELNFNNEADKLRKKERLQGAVANSKSIKELAGNPLLLTMMAILNRNQELPKDRPELYHQASRLLLHQWDVERALIEDIRLDPKTIDYKDKQAMLRQVAYSMQANQKGLTGNLITASDLETILTDYLKTIVDKPREAARVMINQLRTRNFILCFVGADYYAFVHRTFLEYFCAWEFVWQFEKERSISIEQLKTDVFAKHWQDESWNEVLRLIAGMLEPKFTGEIIDYIMTTNILHYVEEEQGINFFLEAGVDRRIINYLINKNEKEEQFINIFLAAELLGEVRNYHIIKSTAHKLLEMLKYLTQYDISYYYETYDKEAKFVDRVRSNAVTQIATLWQDDPNTLSWLKQSATVGNNSDMRIAAVQELIQKFKDDLDTVSILKQLATSDDDGNVRRAAMRKLAQDFQEDPDTLPILKKLAISDVNLNVRRAAMRELARNFKDNPETLLFLKQLITSDKSFLTRRTAVEELARNFKDDPETLLFLKQLITSDNGNVRCTVVQALAKHFKDDTSTLPILKKLANCDDDANVQGEVVDALAWNFKDDPDTLQIIKQLATSEDRNVRFQAAQTLANYFQDDPNTLPFLKEMATLDDDANVRSVVLARLVDNFKDDPDILPIFKQLATSDDHWNVRCAAAQGLADNFKEDPDTLTILKQFATSDDDETVRYTAIRGLAKYFKTNPDLFELFYKCAMNDTFERKEEWGKNPRLLALKIIIKPYPNHPQTLRLLHDRAENDPDEQVREFAKQELAKLN
ncbi:HEAT repeat domain-containing protein [Anabaena cylindrica FACHB-243]|uniref:Signal transduction protein with Nacht domain n=1 Tax=Anabaena cylindrica (strain ATCC 27899 / PCC 7122) TaxID=272123 RepID=K9Z975_ANACC|nr:MULTISPECIES: HEAT repeat domain-containing protein [Anabaena]AFZ55701.1 putative signal transduction protein with Nacht domain [Anabaena cylindrica PCC 7122]MBD2420294.1 HEAT repeat domain-containing protein [Anabaena cylindrica FACHB-243]MBY5282092.1 NACHT domain-containing protein [Anabaena sp. CCAP 1446/1C]MBY5309611.1 NACHT domain-containing protein [Anabaena sp. CCAP 1446/1C]MCM2406051.1 HEAT repeat domain-containing protein [Anabaena sp. CCAP 1446/1C]